MMSDLFDKLAMFFLVTIFFAVASMPYFIYKGAERKAELYNECVTTDYDKFQCYAMIYGGGK
tara:strand:- start:244 stop:429 length:186 start_codon:yes stop_codon:yes gene_type:complete